MRTLFGSMVAALALAVTQCAWAVEMPELTKKHDCDICHEIEKKSVGPAWREVSKRYKGATKYTLGGKEYDLEEGLVMAVSQGSSGNWGGMPMPANDPNGAKKAEIKQLVRFMLDLAK